MAYEEQDYVDGWQTYSNWIDDVRESKIIRKYDQNVKFRKDLLACETNLLRFEHVWDNEEIRQELTSIYEQHLERVNLRRECRLGKSSKESKRMRELGNKYFKENDYFEALNCYTQAVKFAPYPNQENQNDESLALALANRSAALFSLTRYRFCLLDIDLALKYGYPESSVFKLLIRKVKCLHVLSVWTNDVEIIKENLRSMRNNSGTKDFVKIEISNMFEFLEQAHPEEMEKDELDVVDESVMKISNVSKTLSQAADCVEMSYDNEKGRYLMTSKDVSFGRLLIAEDPFVCNLAPSKRSQYCYNCFGRLYNCGLGCKDCTQVLYCSVECLEAKSAIHAHECNSMLDFQEKLGVAYLVTHIMFKIQFDYNNIPVYTRKNYDKRSFEQVLAIPTQDWPDLVYKNDYASLLCLMDHAKDYDYDEISGYCLTSAYLVIAFTDRLSATVLKLKDTHYQKTIGSLVLRHLLQLQTNLISILDQNLQSMVSIGHSISEMQELPIGVGIYPTIALLNHSCRPNILSIFHRNKFVARAATSLECGTEISYCYGPSFTRMSKKDRQRRLKNQYFFNCDCDSCANGKENESRALLCPKCQGPVIYNQDLTHQCLSCQGENLVDVKKVLQKVDDLRFDVEKARLSSIDDVQKLDDLRKVETKLSKLVFWRHPLFAQIKSQLIECAENQEDLESALKYGQEELSLSDKTNGKDSFESMMTELKLVNIKWQHLYNIAEDSETPEATEAAIQGLKNLLLSINATRGKLKDLLNSTCVLGAESSFDTELRFLADVQANINKYLASLKP